MARPSKLTPKTMITIDSVLAEGGSTREAGEAAGVSHTTVVKHAAKRRRRSQMPAGDVERASAEVEAILGAEPATALEDVVARMAVVRGLLARLTAMVEQDEYPATSYVTLCKYADDLARTQAELTPPAPKDPNEDPDVIEAERILLSRVEKLISDAEGRRP